MKKTVRSFSVSSGRQEHKGKRESVLRKEEGASKEGGICCRLWEGILKKNPGNRRHAGSGFLVGLAVGAGLGRGTKPAGNESIQG